MLRKDLLRELIQAAGQFHERQPWKRFTNFDCVGVRLPAIDESLLAVVMGRGGQEHGLSLFRGPMAAACVEAHLDPDGPGDDTLPDADLLGFSMDRFAGLPPEWQELIRSAGIRPRHDELVPHLIAKPPDRYARIPQDTELDLLLWVLKGFVEADRRQLLKPARLDDECGICILTLGGSPEAVDVEAQRAPWPRPVISSHVPASSIDVRGLPHLDTVWQAGLLPMPTGVQNDDRVPRLLLVAEAAEEGDDKQVGRILHALPVMPGDFDQAVKGMVSIACGDGPHGEEGLPRQIFFPAASFNWPWPASFHPLAWTAVTGLVFR